MSIALGTPGIDGMFAAMRELRDWQYEGAPVQLHPGDLGWHWRFGAEVTAAATRTWTRDGKLLALGTVDHDEGLIRLAISPEAEQDPVLARRMVEDLTPPETRVLPIRKASVEARSGGLLRQALKDAGWADGEAWAPLRRGLAEPVPDGGVRIEVTTEGRIADRIAVQRASFSTSTFTEQRWRMMAAGPAYAEARCLVAYDRAGAAVAAVTVWSAGSGRPGLLEPLGVHRDHRGHGYGLAITLAAAHALRELGASSATVCTPSANLPGIATYRAAGFERMPDVRDLTRPEW